MRTTEVLGHSTHSVQTRSGSRGGPGSQPMVPIAYQPRKPPFNFESARAEPTTKAL